MAVPKGLDVPFRMFLQGCSPNVVESDAVLDRSIRTIIRTIPGERPFRPTFGSWVSALVFANMTEGSAFQAASEIRRALAAWETRVTVRDIQFELGDNTISLLIIWRANGGQQDSTSSFQFGI